ncbi:hypothetical protein [Terriglobus sp.]|uniref:hypothetical protein n=1 Tax=Terriglobus sp. TaxID=1889013 RepID=UPI003B0083CA
MPFLLFIARAFIQTFGITQPTPEGERRAAWFIGVLLFVIVAAVVAGFASFAVLHR